MRKDDTKFWANLAITARRDPSGRSRGFGKVVRDATRRKRAEKCMRILKERLDERVQERFRSARNLPVIEALACVRYKISGLGTGVAFAEIPPADRLRVLRLFHKKTGDRRTRPRTPVATQVQVEESFSLALSSGPSFCGMFVEIARRLPVGSLLKVQFNLDQKNNVVISAAHVHYHLEKMGMGILFDGLLPEHENAIEQCVEGHQEQSTAIPAASRCVA